MRGFSMFSERVFDVSYRVVKLLEDDIESSDSEYDICMDTVKLLDALIDKDDKVVELYLESVIKKIPDRGIEAISLLTELLECRDEML